MDSSSLEELPQNRACFEGLMLEALAYGALVMLFIQITQVLVRRPKRGRLFWCIIFYSTAIFPLTTIAFIGKFRFSEGLYVLNKDWPGGSTAYFTKHSSQWPNVISQTCIMLVPWVGDLLVLYRLMVLWNYKWSLVVVPGFIYLARVAMSIPHLISQIRNETGRRAEMYGLVFYILCISLNVMVTILIFVRLFMMRHKAERVLGSIQASLYNSSITMFVESGAFFTFWSVTYLILRVKNHWAQDIFLQPYSFVLALTRMLIILRMAQDRAWSKDIIMAADTGMLDWEVSSVNSLPVTMTGKPTGVLGQQLPNKYREDSLSSKSTQ